ncbi:MAG: VOC family protein [Leifsonia sp.]
MILLIRVEIAPHPVFNGLHRRTGGLELSATQRCEFRGEDASYGRVRGPGDEPVMFHGLQQGMALWMHATGVEAIHDALSAARTPIILAPMDGPFGRTFTFADPDGYHVTVHDRA